MVPLIENLTELFQISGFGRKRQSIRFSLPHYYMCLGRMSRIKLRFESNKAARGPKRSPYTLKIQGDS